MEMLSATVSQWLQWSTAVNEVSYSLSSINGDGGAGWQHSSSVTKSRKTAKFRYFRSGVNLYFGNSNPLKTMRQGSKVVSNHKPARFLQPFWHNSRVRDRRTEKIFYRSIPYTAYSASHGKNFRIGYDLKELLSTKTVAFRRHSSSSNVTCSVSLTEQPEAVVWVKRMLWLHVAHFSLIIDTVPMLGLRVSGWKHSI